MPAKRRLRLLSRLLEGSTEVESKRLCQVSAEVTGMSGAGIMLMADDVQRESMCTTDGLSALLADLQFSLGEGPAVDAYRDRRSVVEPDLATPVVQRWIAFTGPALDAGVRAVFSFPLRIGDVRPGVLNLHCDRPGALTSEQHADALVMADIATRAVLVMQADASPGRLAAALDGAGAFPYVVHQATGMVAAQLGVSTTKALIRLQAHAFGNGRLLTEVAADVVGRTIRLDGSDERDATL